MANIHRYRVIRNKRIGPYMYRNPREEIRACMALWAFLKYRGLGDFMSFGTFRERWWSAPFADIVCLAEAIEAYIEENHGCEIKLVKHILR